MCSTPRPCRRWTPLEPGGLSFDDLTALLAALVAAPSAVGMEVTILDPDLDPDGHLAASFAAVIEAALR